MSFKHATIAVMAILLLTSAACSGKIKEDVVQATCQDVDERLKTAKDDVVNAEKKAKDGDGTPDEVKAKAAIVTAKAAVVALEAKKSLCSDELAKAFQSPSPSSSTSAPASPSPSPSPSKSPSVTPTPSPTSTPTVTTTITATAPAPAASTTTVTSTAPAPSPSNSTVVVTSTAPAPVPSTAIVTAAKPRPRSSPRPAAPASRPKTSHECGDCQPTVQITVIEEVN